MIFLWIRFLCVVLALIFLFAGLAAQYADNREK